MKVCVRYFTFNSGFLSRNIVIIKRIVFTFPLLSLKYIYLAYTFEAMFTYCF